MDLRWRSLRLVVTTLILCWPICCNGFAREELPEKLEKRLVRELRKGSGLLPRDARFIDFLPEASQVVGGILSRLDVITTSGQAATYEVATELPQGLRVNASELLKSSEARPQVLPGITLEGPATLLFHGRRDVDLRLPHSVDAGLVKSIALEEGVAVTARRLDSLEVTEPMENKAVVKAAADNVKNLYILEGDDIVLQSAISNRLKAKKTSVDSLSLVDPRRQQDSAVAIHGGETDLSMEALMELALNPFLNSPLAASVKSIRRLRIEPISLYRVAGAFGPVESDSDEDTLYTVVAGVGVTTSDGNVKEFRTTAKVNVTALELSLSLGSSYQIDADASSALMTTSVSPSYYLERVESRLFKANAGKDSKFVFTETMSPTVMLGNETLALLVEASESSEVLPAERGLILKRNRDT